MLCAVREAGCSAGLALNPGTPVAAAADVAAEADLLLCMSVNPGWGGQSFIDASPAKAAALRALDDRPRIEIDGGIDTGTAPLVSEHVDLFVAGSAIFGKDDPAAAYEEMAAAAEAI